MSARFVFVRRRCVVAAFIFALVILASGAVAVAGVGACLFQVGPVGAHVRLEVRAFVAVAAAAAALSLSLVACEAGGQVPTPAAPRQQRQRNP